MKINITARGADGARLAAALKDAARVRAYLEGASEALREMVAFRGALLSPRVRPRFAEAAALVRWEINGALTELARFSGVLHDLIDRAALAAPAADDPCTEEMSDDEFAAELARIDRARSRRVAESEAPVIAPQITPQADREGEPEHEPQSKPVREPRP